MDSDCGGVLGGRAIGVCLASMLVGRVHGPLATARAVSTGVATLVAVALRAEPGASLVCLNQSGECSCLHPARVLYEFLLIVHERQVVTGGEVGGSAFGQVHEVLSLLAPVCYLVVLGTVLVFAVRLGAGVLAEVVWMVLQFLPAVAVAAVQAVPAGVFVVHYFVLGIPRPALLRPVRIQVGLAAEVLPVVCENTAFSLVVSLLVGAPNCFEMEAVEVGVSLEPVNEVNRDLVFVVGKGAKVAILAHLGPARVTAAELGFVHLWVVKLFNCAVRESAGVPKGTNFLFGFANVRAQFATVSA